MNIINKLTSQWVTGFIDGEGCFHVSIVKNKTMKTGFEVQLQFSITQIFLLPS